MSFAQLVLLCSTLAACGSPRSPELPDVGAPSPAPAPPTVPAPAPTAVPPTSAAPAVADVPRDADAEQVESGCDDAAKHLPAEPGAALERADVVIGAFRSRRIQRRASAREMAAAARCYLAAATAAEALDKHALDYLYDAEELAPGSVPFERALEHVWVSGDDLAYVIQKQRPCHDAKAASPAEARALAMVATDAEAEACTLVIRPGRRASWFLVQVRPSAGVTSHLLAVGCPEGGACAASPLIDVQTSQGAPATIFEAHVDELAVVDLEGKEAVRVTLGLKAWNEIPDREGWENAVQGSWNGTMMAVRWIGDDAAVSGWNLLTHADQAHLVPDLVRDVPPDRAIEVTWSPAGVSFAGTGAGLGAGVVSHAQLAREGGGPTAWLGGVAPAKPL